MTRPSSSMYDVCFYPRADQLGQLQLRDALKDLWTRKEIVLENKFNIFLHFLKVMLVVVICINGKNTLNFAGRLVKAKTRLIALWNTVISANYPLILVWEVEEIYFGISFSTHWYIIRKAESKKIVYSWELILRYIPGTSTSFADDWQVYWAYLRQLPLCLRVTTTVAHKGTITHTSCQECPK